MPRRERDNSPPGKGRSHTGDEYNNNSGPRSSRPEHGRPPLQSTASSNEEQASDAHSSGIPRQYRNQQPALEAAAARASDPTNNEYDYTSISRNPPRQLASGERRTSISADHRHFPGGSTTQAARPGPGRQPPPYHHQDDRRATNAPGNPNFNASFAAQPQISAQRPSYSNQPVQEASYHAGTSYVRDNGEAARDRQLAYLRNLSLDDRMRTQGSINPSVAPTVINTTYASIPISSGPTTSQNTARYQVTQPGLGPLPMSDTGSTQYTSASQAAAQSASSTFSSGLKSNLRTFADIARKDWGLIESYVERNEWICNVDPHLFFNEAIAAYSANKESYANQCIHRVALLNRIKNSKKGALTEIRSIQKTQKSFEDFTSAYDRARKAAKDKAQNKPANNPGPGAMQRPHHIQARPNAPDEPPTADTHPPGYSSPVPDRYPLNPGFPTATPYNRRDAHDRDSFQTPTPIAEPPMLDSRPSDQPISRSGASGPQVVDVNAPSNRSTGEISVTPRNTFIPNLQGRSQLDPRYERRDSSFYQVGTVFCVMWHSEASRDPPKTRKGWVSVQKATRKGKFGQDVYSTPRRMVVVRQARGYCVCIQINTYGGRGLVKFINNPEEVNNHAIIHMSDTQPVYLEDEPRTNKKPISVKKAAPHQSLDPASRLCYSQPSTVQHNVMSMHVGEVTRKCLDDLLDCYWEAQRQ